jgi:hypothetical protein
VTGLVAGCAWVSLNAAFAYLASLFAGFAWVDCPCEESCQGTGLLGTAYSAWGACFKCWVGLFQMLGGLGKYAGWGWLIGWVGLVQMLGGVGSKAYTNAQFSSVVLRWLFIT